MADYDGVLDDSFGEAGGGGGVTRRYSITPEDLGLKSLRPLGGTRDLLAGGFGTAIRAILAGQVGGAGRPGNRARQRRGGVVGGRRGPIRKPALPGRPRRWIRGGRRDARAGWSP